MFSPLIVTCDDLPKPPLTGHNRKTHDVLMALAGELECHGVAYPVNEAEWESLASYWRPYGVKWHRLKRRCQWRYLKSATQRLSLPTVTRDFVAEECIIRELLAGRTDARLLVDFISGGPLLRRVQQGVVLSGHDCMSRLYREEGKHAANWRTRLHFQVRRFFALNAERQFAHRADRMHLITQTDAEEILRVNARARPVVIPIGGNAPPPGKLKPFSERTEKVLWGNLGSPTIRSGMKALLAEAVRTSSVALRGFLLLGKSSEAEARRLLPQMQQLGIRYQSTAEDIGLLLGDASLVVLADLSGTGQKNRTMDALAHGCCVVGMTEVFRGIDNDRAAPAFVQANNATELLSRLEELASASTAAIAARGQLLFEAQFSIPALKLRWCGLFENLSPLRLSDA